MTSAPHRHRLLGLFVLLALTASCSSDSSDGSSAPAVIDDLRGTQVNDTTVHLEWSAPTRREPLTSYQIRYALTEAGLDSVGQNVRIETDTPPRPPGALESYEVTGLHSRTTYFFHVAGRGEYSGLADPSNVVQIFTFPDTLAPSPISDLAVIGRTDHSLKVRWTSPGDDGTIGRATGYVIRFQPGASDEFDFEHASVWPQLVSPLEAGQVDSLSIIGLGPAAEYTVAINAFDEAGNSSTSNLATGTTLPAPPSSLHRGFH